MSNAPNTANAPKKVIVAPAMTYEGVSLTRFIVVGLSSALINFVALGAVGLLFWTLNSLRAQDAEPPPPQTITQIEEETKEYDLTNPDVGLDDTLQLNFNVDRIEDVSVPGAVDPSAPVGILNAPEAAPTNVPAPPGTGGGTGAATFDPTMSGTGTAFGTLGGMGGPMLLGGFGGRSGATRVKMLAEGGGNKLSEAAVGMGLQWLALHQHVEGKWRLASFNRDARTAPLPGGKILNDGRGDNCDPMTNRENETAGTAFGLLPFLAAGLTHQAKPEKAAMDYRKVVERGIAWLMKRQSLSSNDRGYYGGDQYSHAIATIAMCEAYALSNDPKIKPSARWPSTTSETRNTTAAAGATRRSPRAIRRWLAGC